MRDDHNYDITKMEEEWKIINKNTCVWFQNQKLNDIAKATKWNLSNETLEKQQKKNW